jgi:hypothetical protein
VPSRHQGRRPRSPFLAADRTPRAPSQVRCTDRRMLALPSAVARQDLTGLVRMPLITVRGRVGATRGADASRVNGPKLKAVAAGLLTVVRWSVSPQAASSASRPTRAVPSGITLYAVSVSDRVQVVWQVTRIPPSDRRTAVHGLAKPISECVRPADL